MYNTSNFHKKQRQLGSISYFDRTFEMQIWLFRFVEARSARSQSDGAVLDLDFVCTIERESRWRQQVYCRYTCKVDSARHPTLGQQKLPEPRCSNADRMKKLLLLYNLVGADWDLYWTPLGPPLALLGPPTGAGAGTNDVWYWKKYMIISVHEQNYFLLLFSSTATAQLLLLVVVSALGTLFPKAEKLMQRDYDALGADWLVKTAGSRMNCRNRLSWSTE